MADSADSQAQSDAPGRPGIAPTWTSSDKDAVGCPLGSPRLWFTLGHGIVNEVYYPRIDIPQIRDLGFLVADGRGFWAEVKRSADYEIRQLAAGAPAFEITHRHERYRLRLRISPDPRRDVLAIEFHLDGDQELLPYLLMAPHLGATGMGNRAAVEQQGGRKVLTATQGPFALALAAVDEQQRDGIGAASAGYVGTSDGWQDFAHNGAMAWRYERAGPGNVALTGALPRRGVLALGFGSSGEAAATLAISTLLQPFENIVRQQIAEWEGWQARRSERYSPPLDLPAPMADEFLMSATVLRTHLDKTYPGAMVASLSIPWGDNGEERGGYHLVWPRDLVACAGALLALGAEEEARETLRYLLATQQADGHWNQNQWLGGKPYWQGLQLDETAFPVLLAAALADRASLGGIRIEDMVRRALVFLACHGPVTGQERWEENAGINAFTLAVAIAALIEGSSFLPAEEQTWVLDLADFWNAGIEGWLTARGTALAARLGVPAYYVRVAPPEVLQQGAAGLQKPVLLRNRAGDIEAPASDVIGTDFLQLVRFGLRSAEDPIIRHSITAVDALLKVDFPEGPAWRRYTGDGYGEHDDGSPYDGSGRGRPWPLLTGERGHYELAAGHDPLPLLQAMCRMSSRLGLIPEQVWDGPPIPARGLKFGAPSGSARPLAWAHAEFAKLVISRQLGRPVDRPSATWRRYQGRRPPLRRAFWFPHAAIGEVAAGARLVVALPRASSIRWRIEDGRPEAAAATVDTGLGFHAVEIDAANLSTGTRISVSWTERANPAATGGFQVVVGAKEDAAER